MPPIEELIEQRKTEHDSALAIRSACSSENRTATDDEITKMEEHAEAVDKLTADIDRERRTLENTARLEEQAAELKKPVPKLDVREWAQPKGEEDEDDEYAKWRYTSNRRRAFRGFKEPERVAYRSGRWLMATLFGDETSRQWCLRNGIDCRSARENRALSIGEASAGGYLVPRELSQAIVDNRELYGDFRANTMVAPMATDTLDWPIHLGGTSATWASEGTSQTESDAAFGNITLRAQEMTVDTRLSRILASDGAIDVANFVAEMMGSAFAEAEDGAGFIGDGTDTYGHVWGLATKLADGTHAAGIVEGTAGTAFTGVTAAEIHTLMGSLPKYARRNAKFACSPSVNALVFDRLKVTGGGNTIQTLEGEVRPAFLGHEIIVTSTLPGGTSGTTDEVFMLFGDFQRCSIIGDRQGFQFLTSEHLYFRERQIALQAVQRIDIVAHSLGDGTTAGAIVGMDSD